MNSLSDKPGVIGAVGTLGNAIKQGAANEVKKTVKNTLEQLDLAGPKESKEKLVETAASADPTPDELKKQSQEVTNWLYGTSSPEPVTLQQSMPEPLPAASMVGEPKTAEKATLQQQLGLEQTGGNTANVVEQLGLDQNHAPTASFTDQLNVLPGPTLTPEEQQKQQQLRSQLHNDYYQRLVNPQQRPDTEERQKEAIEEQESAQERMERLAAEDFQKKQEKAEKEKPIAAVDQAQNAEKHRGSMG